MKKSLLILSVVFLLPLAIKAQSEADSLDIYLKKYQYQKALSWLDKKEDSKQNQYEKAMCYKILGDNRKATHILEELAEKYPEDIRIKTELAKIYETTQRWHGGTMVYSDLMKMDTTNVYFAIKKAESELNRKNTDQSIKDLGLVLEKDSSRTALFLMAKSYDTANNLDSAAYFYNIGWSRDTMDVAFASNLIYAHIKQKDFPKALSDAQLYLKKDTTDNSINYLYGFSLYAMDDYEGAIKVLQKCFSSGDSTLVVVRSLGMSYYNMGESDQSYKYLSKAFEMDTTHNVVLNHLAISASDIGKYDEAEKYFGKLLYRLIPSKMQLYANYRGLAIAYEKNKKYDEAAQCYEKAIENATQTQAFYMYEPLAHLYNEFLNRKRDALFYYESYRTTMDGKLLNLKHAPPEEDNTKEMEEFTKQLAELDVFINELREELNEVQKQKKPFVDPHLYVVNNEVVEKMPQQNGETNFHSTKAIFNFDKITDSEQPFVEIAKERGKKVVIIIEMDEIPLEEEKSVEIQENTSTD